MERTTIQRRAEVEALGFIVDATVALGGRLGSGTSASAVRLRAAGPVLTGALETTVDARRALFWVDKVELESFRGEVRRDGIEAATISPLVSSLGIPELGFSE
jgi:hypothetical protein